MPTTPELTLTALTVEHLQDPAPIATPLPRFGWVIAGDAAGVRQTAYELELSTEGTVIWSSGRVESPASTAVRYTGEPLRSRTAYDWRVRAWIEGRPEPTDWASAHFETSLLDLGEWQARWVRPVQPPAVREYYSAGAALAGLARPEGPPQDRLHPPRQLRQVFQAAQQPSRARLYISARGIYEARLNGAPVGDEVLAPGFNSYPSRLSFQAYDITDQVAAGENVLGVTLADGWYLGRIGLSGSSANYGEYLEGIWQLELEYPDGSSQVVVSGPDVRSATGPWVYADLFIGEYYDARAEVPGWSQAGFDDADWSPVEVRDDALDQLTPFAGEPIRRVLEFPAERVFRDSAGELVVDLGQVIAGWVRLRVQAPAGTHLTLEHSETLDADGVFFSNIMGPNKDQTDHYIARGEPDGEVYEPTFTFHGFRYVRVRGLPGDLAPGDVTAVVIASDLAPTSELTTSDDRINRLHANVLWSQRANFLSIPTDCPQRERAGWTGDLQVFIPTAATNANVLPFVERWLADLRADQLLDGQVPIIVPTIPALAGDDLGGDLQVGPSSAAWSDAVTMVPWALYERYGDEQVLRDNYDAMVQWVEYQTRIAAAELHPRFAENPPSPEQRARQAALWNTGFHFGDWLAPSTLVAAPMPDAAMIAPALTAELVAPMFQANSLKLIAQVAKLLGREKEAADYAERHQQVREAFAAEYFDADGRLPVQMQGPYVVALAFDLVPEELKPRVVEHLAELVRAAGDHLDTGFVSVPYLLDVLWEGGQPELARRLLWQDTLPSWLYEVDHGATTIWETWGAVLPDGTVTPASMNHYAFGCVDDWLFRRLAGIQPTEPGYRRSRIQPDFDAGLDLVRASHLTPYGRLAVEWERTAEGVAVRVEVPHNTEAELVLGGHPEVVGSGSYERVVTA